VSSDLRVWQQQALTKYLDTKPHDFLAVATPGAGKTTFALKVATELKTRRTVDRIIVVVPTEHLKVQWSEAAARVGLSLDPAFKNTDAINPQYDGVVVTYAQVAMHPYKHYAITTAKRSLVILDEIHHGGDAKSWGDGIREAYQDATRRLALTGTPFRSDDSTIPFVRYAEDGEGHLVSQADHTYGYSDALADGVVRPVVFLAYSGEARWRTSAGEEFAARLGEPLNAEQTARAWKTALDPQGDWIPAVLRAAHTRLHQLRKTIPDAGGLVIATDKTTARAYAKILAKLATTPVSVVLSDEAGASERIEKFAGSTDEWMVAVRMVSEGVDVPRLAVGVYATSTSTPLFFAQAIGRFVRARKRGETASVFLPSVPQLMMLANDMEVERDHALDRHTTDDDIDPMAEGLDDEALEEANREERASEQLARGKFEAIGSQASFHGVLFDGSEFSSGGLEIGSEEEQDFLGIPGLLDADQVGTLLRARQREHASRRPATAAPAIVDHRQLKEMRNKLAKNVAAWSIRSGKPHGVIHNELRKICGGPAVAQASAEQIQARLDKLADWFVGRSS